MAFVHGKDTFVSLNGSDLSAPSNSVEFGRSADSHDVTGFGKDAHVKQGGLLDGTCTISGTYDNGAASPEAVIEPLLGTNVTLIYRPEGTGSGLPQKSVSVLVQEYTETAPVADMITWAVSLEFSDDLTKTTQ
jgi:hypothetical protein